MRRDGRETPSPRPGPSTRPRGLSLETAPRWARPPTTKPPRPGAARAEAAGGRAEAALRPSGTEGPRGGPSGGASKLAPGCGLECLPGSGDGVGAGRGGLRRRLWIRFRFCCPEGRVHTSAPRESSLRRCVGGPLKIRSGQCEVADIATTLIPGRWLKMNIIIKQLFWSTNRSWTRLCPSHGSGCQRGPRRRRRWGTVRWSSGTWVLLRTGPRGPA